MRTITDPRYTYPDSHVFQEPPRSPFNRSDFFKIAAYRAHDQYPSVEVRFDTQEHASAAAALLFASGDWQTIYVRAYDSLWGHLNFRWVERYERDWRPAYAEKLVRGRAA